MQQMTASTLVAAGAVTVFHGLLQYAAAENGWEQASCLEVIDALLAADEPHEDDGRAVDIDGLRRHAFEVECVIEPIDVELFAFWERLGNAEPHDSKFESIACTLH